VQRVRREEAVTLDPTIVAAVKYARMELHAQRPNRKPDTHIGAASAGDHIAARDRITEMVDGQPTPEKVLAPTGMTFPRLVAVARFAPDSADDLKTLGELGKAFAKDKNASWRPGRYLAGIVAAWVVQLRADAKPAKTAEKEAAAKS
jgi:hypothetical protein